MIEEFKKFLIELQDDSTEFGKKQASKLEKYIKKFESGEFSKEEFVSFVSDLTDLQDIEISYIEVKTKATLQKIKNTCQELLSLLSKN